MNEIAEARVKSSIFGRTEGMEAMEKRSQRWLLIAAFVIAAVLRIYLASRSGLRPDELFSLGMATGHSLEHPVALADPRLGDFVEPVNPVPAEEFRHYLQHDNPPAGPARVIRAVLLSDTSPPLYYLLLYGWTLLFGTSDLSLRLFSTACSLACFPFFVSIARRTGGKEAVGIVCLIFAFSPLAIYYSADGRMYPLLWLWVLATMTVSLAIRERASVGLFTLWVLTSAAGFLTHYFFVFAWMAVVAYLFFSPGRLKRLQLALCGLATALICLPWYMKVPQSLAGWRITKDWLKSRPADFSRVGALRDIVYQFFAGHEKHLWVSHRSWNLPPVLLVCAIAVLVLWRLRSRAVTQSRLLLALVFAGVCAGPLIFDLVQRTYTVAWPRYAIAALPAAYLLVSAGLACLPARSRLLMLCLIVIAWLPNLFIMYRDPAHWTPIREVALIASMDAGPGDLLLVHSIPSGVLGVARYARGPAPMASWIGQLGTRRMPESLNQLAAARKRIVFVKLHEVGEPAPEEDWLRANATISRETHFELAEAVNFRPRGSETF